MEFLELRCSGGCLDFGSCILTTNQEPPRSSGCIYGECESSLSTPNASDASIDNLTKSFVEQENEYG